MKNRVLLLVNDDGFFAQGLRVLAQVLERKFEIWVVAPAHEVSAIGHAITLREILRIEEKSDRYYIIHGNPVDCVNLALYHLLPEFPDCILSGINHGWNLGEDVFYSGTVAGAMEGCIHGVRSFALSVPRSDKDHMRMYFESMAQWIRDNIEWLCQIDVPPQVFFNINWPDTSNPEGYVWTALARMHYKNAIDVRIDPCGGKYYWIQRKEHRLQPEPDSDVYWIRKKRISITPLSLDMTDRQVLRQLQS